MEKREGAIQALIDSVKARFPERGFEIHPAVHFCSSRDGGDGGGGISVVAQERIAKDEILLVIPESIRCSVSGVLTTKEHKMMIKKLLQKCAQWPFMFDLHSEIELEKGVQHIGRSSIRKQG